ncbi:MAG: ISL3 family transposase [Anaerocolumna aminovalerica]|jgi:transposase|uniref:ISL3 family transposase n=1 Tax=Anaerocolumna aminovalerica TaxID=1527 RepID=UPI001C0EC63F|nr:ISL3 family transposase [Anaerocolumna aminovalerica]MBU5334785.1 ISL3 family transposase [Anaerocolumna aminovalerica]MDU6266683.1 ISL3 family transposase [Anaerocolumna aminovalerica]
MHSNCTKNLLNLEDVFIKKVVHAEHYVKIFIETKPSIQTCPDCGTQTKRIHDYRFQEIKDIPFQMKYTYLVLKKRRYVCKCGKRFTEKYHFLPSYQRRTLRLSFKIIDQLRNLVSIKSVAETTNVSVSTVTRLLDTVRYPAPSLVECISIDEFKGNTDAGKYQCILTDARKHRILDILPDRTQSHLSSYFRETSREERHRVKFFVCDMWEPYVDLAKAYFPNATIIIDKYHFIRYVTWAIENVRKRLQKTMPANLRKYYKRSRKLILTRYHKLREENKKACDLMLLYNDDLRQAHHLKEWFYDICQNKKYSYQRTAFWEWVKAAEKSGIPEFENCARTYRNWSEGILNAFKYKYTNGPTEGYNNKIKVLKRISFGVRNFNRFRTRIIHCSI